MIELKSLDCINPQELAYHANEKNLSRFLKDSFPYPYTLEHALSFIEYSLKHHQLDFGIVVDGLCVGCISATLLKDVYKKNCEIGYWLSSRYANHGIMKKVIAMFCDYLFTHFHIHKIYAEVFAENIASRKVLTANFFQEEGYLKEHIYKNFQYEDLVIYGLCKGDFYDKKINTL